MKLPILFISVLLSISLPAFVFSQNCQFGKSTDSISLHDIKIIASTYSEVYIKNGDYSKIWLNRWVGGKTFLSLNLAASLYKSKNKNDFYPGPLDDVGKTNQQNCNKWDKVFKVYRTDIEDFKVLFENGNLTENNIPLRIKYWPGRLNPYLKSDFNIFVHTIFADYIDVDNNDIYDPLKGDYPNIFGSDELLFWLINDNGGPHTLSYAEPTQVTIARYAYTYNSNPDPAISKTIFFKDVHISLFYSDLFDFYNCIFMDYDSPDSKHDKFGTIPDKNATYIFNQCGFIPCNFTNEIVHNEIVTTKILHTDYLDTIGNNLGLSSSMFNIDANYWGRTPDDKFSFYNFMKGIWRDGTPLTYGDLGHTLSNPNEVKFGFDNLQSVTTKWTLCDDSVFLGDLRVYLGIGPSTFHPGDIKTIDYAISFFNIDQFPCNTIDSIEHNLDIIQNFYDSGMTDNLEVNSKSQIFNIYPNPNNGKIWIAGNNDINTFINILDVNGNYVMKTTMPSDISEYEIDLSGLKPGLYFLFLVNKEKLQIEKVIIQY